MKLSLFVLFIGVTIKGVVSFNSRIIGGQLATIHEFPFAAAIQVSSVKGNYFCGGTLYTNQYIITAGQCVAGADLFVIRLGSASRTDSNFLRVATFDYFLHPEFNNVTLDNDIGIIKLHMPIQFTDVIKSIDYLAQEPLPQSQRVKAIGWGQTSDYDANLAEDLQAVFVIPLSNQECTNVYGSQVTENMVCVEGNNNEGACYGDTGSPLVDVFGRYSKVLVGISSFVSGNGCESTDPSGYVRIYNYVEWIHSIVL